MISQMFYDKAKLIENYNRLFCSINLLSSSFIDRRKKILKIIKSQHLFSISVSSTTAFLYQLGKLSNTVIYHIL